MKIAIITFSDFNTNYGSMLQAYALNEYLANLGHEVVFIKYREFNNVYLDMNVKQKIINFAKSKILKLYSLIKSKDINNTKSNFEMFKQKLVYTDLYTSNEDLKCLSQDFDCFICGSDQIWNLECLGGLRKAYFLDFVDKSKIKIAYAASVGDYRFKDSEKKTISYLLENIDYISVRELETIGMINEFSKKDIMQVVDPTFLLKKNEWENVLPKCPIDTDYGVCYFVRRSKFGKRVVKKLGEKYRIPIYNLSDNNIYINGTNSKYISSGPLEFLSLLSNAKFAVGTSFHLTVFSVIFEIPFIIVGLEHNRNRINNILKVTGLEENFVSDKKAADYAIENLFTQKIHKNRLYEKIEESKLFLKNALENKKIGN